MGFLCVICMSMLAFFHDYRFLNHELNDSTQSNEYHRPWQTFHRLRRKGSRKVRERLLEQSTLPQCKGFLPCIDILTQTEVPPAGTRFPGEFIFFIETRDLQETALHRIQDSMLCD